MVDGAKDFPMDKDSRLDAVHAAKLMDEAIELATDLIDHARDLLLCSVRFLNRPLASLPAAVDASTVGCSTDGSRAVFSPGYAIDLFRDSPQRLAHAYLHMILHCLLRHSLAPSDVDPLRWSVACDMAVFELADALLPLKSSPETEERKRSRDRYLKDCDAFTAVEIYRMLERDRVSEPELADLELIFGVDSHLAWFLANDEADDERPSTSDLSQMRERWERIARETELDAAVHDGTRSKPLSASLRDLRIRPLSLSDLLRQYLQPVELMVPESFDIDFAYYAYGFRSLGKIALVEPLETAESTAIGNLFVALDTSGSIGRERATRFVELVCGMLFECEFFGDGSCVHVLQCDDSIRGHDVISGKDDLRRWMTSVELHGFGATDFRPVFDLIHEFMGNSSADSCHVDGLIYFTDGRGTFPEKAPLFDAAFAFVDAVAPIPSWATQVLVLSEELAVLN